MVGFFGKLAAILGTIQIVLTLGGGCCIVPMLWSYKSVEMAPDDQPASMWMESSSTDDSTRLGGDPSPWTGEAPNDVEGLIER